MGGLRSAPLMILAIMGATAGAAETIDPAEVGAQHAWSENAGWGNAEPLGDGGPGLRVTDEGVTGWLWLENVGWVSASCFNTGSCATVDYGIAVGAGGALSGMAWSENAGWIVFGCETTASCGTVDYGVTVDLVTGRLAGHAWAENLGWIVFSCDTTGSCASVDYGVTTETPIADELFTDNFETADPSRWHSTIP